MVKWSVDLNRLTSVVARSREVMAPLGALREVDPTAARTTDVDRRGHEVSAEHVLIRDVPRGRITGEVEEERPK